MPDNIEKGAKEIADLMDAGKGTEVAERLRSDFLNMTPDDFRKLVNTVASNDKQGTGFDITLSDRDKNGLPEVTLVDSQSGFLGFFQDKELVIGTQEENSMNVGGGKGPGHRLIHTMQNDTYKDAVVEQER